MEKEDLNNEEIYCPLYKKNIKVEKCFDLAMVIDKLAPRRTTDFEIENTPNCENVCKNCKYHDI